MKFMLIDSLFSGLDTVGFSGSRHGIDSGAGELTAAAVPAGAGVVVGCAAGVDAFFRSRFPAARVLRVDSSLGRAGFARRSIACVEAVSSLPQPLDAPHIRSHSPEPDYQTALYPAVKIQNRGKFNRIQSIPSPLTCRGWQLPTTKIRPLQWMRN